MRDWRHVGDAGDLVAAAVQCTNGGFTTRTWTLDVYVEVLQAVFQRSLTSTFSSNLGCERGGFARTTETRTTGGRPGQSIALTVGDGHDGVVERSVDVAMPSTTVFLTFLRGRAAGFAMSIFLGGYLRIGLRGPYGCVRWSWCADREPADLYDDAGRGSNPGPSSA